MSFFDFFSYEIHISENLPKISQWNSPHRKKNWQKTKKTIWSVELALDASNKPKNDFVRQKLILAAQFENMWNLNFSWTRLFLGVGARVAIGGGEWVNHIFRYSALGRKDRPYVLRQAWVTVAFHMIPTSLSVLICGQNEKVFQLASE